MNDAGHTIARFTAADGYRLAARVWTTPRPAARLVLLHGIVSHSSWYTGTGDFLSRAGVEVHALDRRGSGLNQQARGDVPHARTWLDDVYAYLDALGRTTPIVLAGISWGGKLAAALAAEHAKRLAGLALVCPGIFARQQARPWQRLALRAAAAAGLGRLRVAIPLKDPALFTQTAASQQFISADPLALRRITVRFALADLDLTRLVRAAAEAIQTPVLLMLAGREPIVDNAATRAYFQRLEAADKTCLEYPEAGHTLEFEPDPTRYWGDLAQWIGRVASGH